MRWVKISLSENLVEEQGGWQGLAALVNQALREKLEYRRRNRLLSELLDQLDAEYGPVDESLVLEYAGLLRSSRIAG